MGLDFTVLVYQFPLHPTPGVSFLSIVFLLKSNQILKTPLSQEDETFKILLVHEVIELRVGFILQISQELQKHELCFFKILNNMIPPCNEFDVKWFWLKISDFKTNVSIIITVASKTEKWEL